MKVYIVRHGESQDGAHGYHQKPNSPLTEKGLNQADSIARKLTRFKINSIFSSPLPRARTTAQIISQKINRPVIEAPLLKELKRPSEIEGQPTNNQKVLKIKNKIWESSDDPFFQYPDEETFIDFKKRIAHFLNQLSKTPQENILLVTHSLTTKMILALAIIGDSLSSKEFLNIYDTFIFNKVGLTILEHSKEKNWQLITWNDQIQLG
ncbi:histidine phosphatase family protein [Patescibacteria group bacterium]